MANHPEIKVAATANRMAELSRLAEIPPPDVVIIDANEPGVDSAAVMKRLSRLVQPAKVLVFSSQGGREMVLHMVRCGVGGYLHKKAGEAEIVKAVESVGNGDTYLGQKAAAYLLEEFTQLGVAAPAQDGGDEDGGGAVQASGQDDSRLDQKMVAYLRASYARPQLDVVPGPPPQELTLREAEILALLGKRLGNLAIGQELGVSLRTVDYYRNKLREKLGLPSQKELRNFAVASASSRRRGRGEPKASKAKPSGERGEGDGRGSEFGDVDDQT